MDYRVILIHIFNFTDAVLTLFAVKKGVEEANPVMNFFLAESPELFLLVKFFLLTICIEYLHVRLKGKARVVLTLLLAVFLSVTSWLLYWYFIGGFLSAS